MTKNNLHFSIRDNDCYIISSNNFRFHTFFGTLWRHEYYHGDYRTEEKCIEFAISGDGEVIIETFVSSENNVDMSCVFNNKRIGYRRISKSSKIEDLGEAKKFIKYCIRKHRAMYPENYIPDYNKDYHRRYNITELINI